MMKQMIWPSAIFFEQLHRVEKKHFDQLFDKYQLVISNVYSYIAHAKTGPIQSCFLRPCIAKTS